MQASCARAMNLKLDLVGKELVPAGPVPAVAAFGEGERRDISRGPRGR
jgi:hypothetical protein